MTLDSGSRIRSAARACRPRGPDPNVSTHARRVRTQRNSLDGDHRNRSIAITETVHRDRWSGQSGRDHLTTRSRGGHRARPHQRQRRPRGSRSATRSPSPRTSGCRRLRNSGTPRHRCGSAPCACRASRIRWRRRHTRSRTRRPRREPDRDLAPFVATGSAPSRRRDLRSRCSVECISRASSDLARRYRHPRTRRRTERSRDTPVDMRAATFRRTLRRAGGRGASVDRGAPSSMCEPLGTSWLCCRCSCKPGAR